MSRLVLELEQATPAFIGYYEPSMVDERYFLRPTSVKGVWRWFARALVGGVLYDYNRLCGRTSPSIVRIPERREVEAVSEIVGKDLGLGYAGKEGSETSIFTIRVEVTRRPRIYEARRGVIQVDGGTARLQRVQLLTLGRRSLRYFVGGSFRLVIEPRRLVRPGSGYELALRLLLLAFTLSGFGKGSRRGLGCFDVVNIRGLDIVKGFEHNFREFMQSTYRLATAIVARAAEKTTLSTCRQRGLPPYPVLATATAYGRKVSEIYRLTGASWVVVHNFFVRGERCRVLYGNHRCPDRLREKLNAWILGLPRSQRRTGYIVRDDVKRRASPFLVSAHENRHILGGGVYVTVMVSGDWPKVLEWYGGGKRQILVDERRIVDAVSDAVDELLRYVGTPGISPVWP